MNAVLGQELVASLGPSADQLSFATSRRNLRSTVPALYATGERFAFARASTSQHHAFSA